jgi:prevent-host-death family protein
MADVSIRELRRKGGQVIDQVIAGEVPTVTRHGQRVARQDLDRLFDPSL